MISGGFWFNINNSADFSVISLPSKLENAVATRNRKPMFRCKSVVNR